MYRLGVIPDIGERQLSIGLADLDGVVPVEVGDRSAFGTFLLNGDANQWSLVSIDDSTRDGVLLCH